MSTPSPVEAPSVEEQEDFEMDDHLDTSSNQHDSSKEDESAGGESSSTKPKRTRKSTQRLLDSFMDEDVTFAHKAHKKKRPSSKKIESSSEEPGEPAGDGASESGDPSGSHETSGTTTDDATDKEGKRPRVVPGKAHVQCTFMESKKKANTQCKQRVIEGYLFCIWHILNDAEAPYKRCAHLRDSIKSGVVRKMQCKTAIRILQQPPFCLAHSGKIIKKRTKRDTAGEPSPASTMLTASPPPPGPSKSTPSPSPAPSSLFNLPNEDFSLDIDEALGNLGSDSFMDTFDDFVSIDNIIDEEEAAGEDAPPPGPPPPLPFDLDREISEHERALMDELILPPFEAGRKLIQRLTAMRNTVKNSTAFWQASSMHAADVPDSPRAYYEAFMADARLDRMSITDEHRAELRALLADTELAEELALMHKYNTDLLGEMATLQRAVINSAFREHL